MVQKERLLQTFLSILRIDSLSRQERAMADEIRARCTRLNLEVIEDGAANQIGGTSGNLIVRLPGRADKHPILITSHLDTVVPGKGIVPRIEGDRIRSDGTTILGADDKVGVASMLEMLEVFSGSGEEHAPIEFLFTVGEESGLLGSRHLDRSLLTANVGFAFDSTGPVGTIVVQGPAQTRIDALIHGKAAHAGVAPEEGISAIVVASRAISAMKLGRIDEATTANIGSLIAEGPTNIVCERASLSAEARSLFDDRLERQVSHMRETLVKTAETNGATAEVTTTDLYTAFHHEASSEVVQIGRRAVEKLGLSCSLIGTGGGSDANVLNGLGIPTINFAVGYEDIHTTKESIRVEDVIRCAELMMQVIRESAV